MERKINTYKLLMNTVYEISMALNSSIEIEPAMKKAMHIVGSYLNIENGFILLKDEATGDLKLSGSIGVSPETAKKIVYKEGEGIVGKVYKYGLPMLIMNVLSEPDFQDKLKRKGDVDIDFMAVPIRSGENVYGVLAIDKHSSDFHNNEPYLDFLKMVGNLLSAYIQKMMLINKEKDTLKEEKERLLKEVTEKFSFKGLVGNSKIMRDVFQKIEQVKNSPTTILIRGESGTGKELVARAIHYSGNRAKKPFVTVNCAAIPAELIESELFGHKKGSFTGAYADKKGKFEAADGGTIFLDEIGDMPYEAQSKLLRVLQERCVEKIGETKSISVDVRVIAATNRDLEEDIKLNKFRIDLYYRLNVVNIFTPPLRNRKEDIPDLALNAVNKLSKSYDKEFKLHPSLYGMLSVCDWPGNIRELENCIERAALSSSDGTIRAEDLSCSRGELCYAGLNRACIAAPQIKTEIQSEKLQTYSLPAQNIAAEPAPQKQKPVEIPLSIEDEIKMVVDALEKTGWVQAKAARMLGMTVRQINYRIKKYNINVKII